MPLSDISNYLKYDPTSSTFLRWIKTDSKQIKSGDEAGFFSIRTYRIKFESIQYYSSQIIYYLHNGIIPKKVTFLDGNRRNLSIDNLIASEFKPKTIRKKRSEINITEMKQPDIQPDITYTWKLNKNMINLFDENGQIVRKFKNQYVQDEDFITNIRIEIILRFGIAPKNLKEKNNYGTNSEITTSC